MADSDKPSREERLAARLRENLHRRKAQSRALAQETASAPAQDTPLDTPPAPLSKEHPDG